MLKIRSTPTEAEQTGYMNSQSTEPEKAEFHTPAIPNTVRDCVQENSLESISPDPVQMTLPRSDTYPQASSSFLFKIRRQGGNCRYICTCNGDTQGTRYLHSRILKVNKKELWEASQFI